MHINIEREIMFRLYIYKELDKKEMLGTNVIRI